MITPTRIEVRNIRSVTHAVIEPLGEGITALSGPIGTGKSSLINGALWAMYGEVGGIAGLLSQNEMRRKDCPDGEPVEATVEFTLNGTDYKAVRRLRRSKSGKETASAEWWVGGVKQSQITPTKLTEKITALTGLTGRAYTGAFFIPQGNLPVLAEGTPAEVQRLIEEQTGLTPLTRRCESARREAKDAQITADALPGSVEIVDAAQAEVDAAQDAGEKAWKAKETAEAREAKARQAWEEAHAAAEQVTARARAAQQARENLAGETARLGYAREQVESLTVQASEHPVLDSTDAQDAASALRAAAQGFDAATTRARHATIDADTAADEARQAREHAASRPDHAGDLASARTAEQDANARRGAAKGEWERLNRAITALRATSPQDACCPTCTQHLPDPHGLLADLTAHQERVIADGKKAAADLTEITARIEEITVEQAATDRARQAATDATARAEKARDAAQAATQDADRAVTALIETVTTHARYTGGLDSDDPAAARAVADTGIDAATRALAEQETARRVAADLTRWTERVTDCEAKIEALTVAAADAPTDQETIAATEAAAASRAVFDTETSAAATARADARVATQAVAGAEQTRDRARADLDAKTDAALHADTLRHAADLLTALRKDLLAEYTATISASATDLMAQVGGGVHAGVVIDQNFTPCVTLADGTLRPMRVLSGGEKMRAALCLRLGIADQITGGASGEGMIFADEITANHDAATTAAVVDLIRSLGRPMLVIAHADEVDQAANRVYHLTKPAETVGTQVALAGAVPALPDPAAVA